MKTGTKIALWVGGIAIVGIGGFFIWKSVTKKRNVKCKDAIIEEIHKSFAANPPKSREEALERALKVGVTEQDLNDNMARELADWKEKNNQKNNIK